MSCGVQVLTNSITLNALYYLIILQFSAKSHLYKVTALKDSI